MCCSKDLVHMGTLLISFIKGSSPYKCSFEWSSLPKNMCTLWI
ncbi:hypothetical protein F383_18687 [Gossypium arboreum]|uniref:Uncharacterized protein n=1 Tax=Gossypium arboreum TaxID=29729 RepID=A0A0B0NGH0_GOSAR|nr:hypothetical protein F383_18687 [Gossypium arboreum]